MSTTKVDNITATGGEGTAVDVNAPEGNANVTGTTLNNYTGDSAKVNATNATVKETTIAGGEVKDPQVTANHTDIDTPEHNHCFI